MFARIQLLTPEVTLAIGPAIMAFEMVTLLCHVPRSVTHPSWNVIGLRAITVYLMTWSCPHTEAFLPWAAGDWS